MVHLGRDRSQERGVPKTQGGASSSPHGRCRGACDRGGGFPARRRPFSRDVRCRAVVWGVSMGSCVVLLSFAFAIGFLNRPIHAREAGACVFVLGSLLPRFAVLALRIADCLALLPRRVSVFSLPRALSSGTAGCVSQPRESARRPDDRNPCHSTGRPWNAERQQRSPVCADHLHSLVVHCQKICGSA